MDVIEWIDVNKRQQMSNEQTSNGQISNRRMLKAMTLQNTCELHNDAKRRRNVKGHDTT
jgi:hypothetical protein